MTSAATPCDPLAIGPRALSKRCLDIGYFTNRGPAVLEFWQREIGLHCEEPVPYNQGLIQYRHALHGSIIKINTARDGVAYGVPSGYRELFIARADVSTPTTLADPDGNPITLVPPGYAGITGLGIRINVRALAAARHFYGSVMGFPALDQHRYAAGSTVVLLDEQPDAQPAGHWVNAGLRYLTLHVKRVDASYAAHVAAGATPGEAPYSIGRIARISFVRDADGNWIEVAQRAALAGPWWEDDAAGT